ncbi:PucR family transcriptional regulator [Bacillus sp. J33]|uniref:PucR family transcriptional regulator n=1 Tax=Bacillus sp. J33 TaxID=935836 RepID=UPI00047CADF7|nr:PucR family transcriptional regulator ligand-binding domain-containing protein [Bacillus sp. J33]
MPTIQDILELEILSGAKVRTAKHTLRKKPVEWVSIMDIPVENYIRQNEFVLNTGAGSGHDMDVFQQFVESVYESGAAALAIAKGKYIHEIPAGVLAFAEDKEFPIIEIPWEIRFADIIHSILSEINSDQKKEMIAVENIQQTLLNMILGNQNLSKIAQFISEKLSLPLMIADKNGVIIGKCINSKDLMKDWNDYLGSIQNGLRTSLINSRHPLRTRIEKIKLVKHVILQIPIQSANRIQGYQIIGAKDESEAESYLTNQNISILEHASTVLAMWFLRENAIEETKVRLRGDFVWSLAKGDFSSWDQKIAQAKSLGYVLDLPYVCLIGTPENLKELYLKTDLNTSFELWKESIMQHIQSEIFHAANIGKQKVMTTNHGNDMILFLETAFLAKREKVHSFLDRLNRRLNQLLPGVIMSWGIGRCHEGERTFIESYEDAQKALKIGRRKVGKGCCIHFEDTRIERALLRMAKDQEMTEIVNQTIKALIDYDQQKNSNLLETVIVYIQNQGNTSQTARELHLHRHTLLYRLKKIETLTHLSMIDPEDRFLLDLSIKLWKLGETNNKD